MFEKLVNETTAVNGEFLLYLGKVPARGEQAEGNAFTKHKLASNDVEDDRSDTRYNKKLLLF